MRNGAGRRASRRLPKPEDHVVPTLGCASRATMPEREPDPSVIEFHILEHFTSES